MYIKPLSEKAIRTLKKVGKRQTFAKNKVLMKSGGEFNTQGTYYIVSGSVLIYVQYNTSNDQCVLDYLHQGDFVGEMPLFAKTQYRSATVRTNEDCELLLIDNQRMRRLMANDSEILMYLSSQLAFRLHQTTQRLYTMSFHGARERLMHFLLLSARKMAPEMDFSLPTRGPRRRMKPIELRITRREIGHTIGCSRETAGRQLKDLERQGYLDLDGMTIILVEPVKMIIENFERDIARIWLD